LSAASLAAAPPVYSGVRLATPIAIGRAIPFDEKVRQDTLDELDNELVDKGILDAKTKEVSEKVIRELSWERREILPTPGVLVKGCLDNCETCEPALQKEIELELEHKQLDNEMLKRQIEILEKSQEYRCCPAGSSEAEEPPGA